MADANIRVTFHLPPLLAKVFEQLINSKYVTDEQIAAQHRSAVNPPIRMTIHRLRQALKPFQIEIYNDRAIGYWMVEGDKDRVRELLAKDTVATRSNRQPVEDAPQRAIPE